MRRPQNHRRKCCDCRELFAPDYRNSHHQKYCTKPACHQVSKQVSQRRWAHKAENREYFRGVNHVQRVQAWRKAHPGYWKKRHKVSDSHQDVGNQTVIPEQKSCNAPGSLPPALQDFCLTQDSAFVGLISLVTGSTLQDDIAATVRKLFLRGQNILG